MQRNASPLSATKIVAGLVGLALLVATAVVAERSSASADIIEIDPPDTDCDPSMFVGLPFNPCDALDADPGVDDPDNPCDGLIISGQRRNTPEVVVQYFNVPNPDPSVLAPVSGVPVCLMEQEVIADLAAERGVELNAEERAEILAFGRDEIRARLFARLINLQDRANAGESLTTMEQGALAWAQAVQINGQRAIADAARAEYDAWKAAPCLYVPPAPHQYNVSGDPGCAGGIAGLFTSVTPPTYHDFVTYGMTRITDGHHGAAALATAEMSVALQVGLAASTYATGSIGALLTFGSLGAGFVTALKVAIFPFGAAGMAAKTAAAGGAASAGAAGGGGAAFFASAVAVVVVLTIVTIIRVAQLFEQAAIGSQLEADQAAAQSTSAEIDPQTFLMLFADATVPIFDPPANIAASATPGPAVTGPYFTTTKNGITARSNSIVYRSLGKNYRAWISDGWWVVEPVGFPDQRTLEPYLILLSDAGDALGFVSYSSGQIIVVDAASAASGSLFLALAPPANPADLANPVMARFEVDTPATVTPTATSVTVDEGGDVTISGVATGATGLTVNLFDGDPPIAVTLDPLDGSFSITRRYSDDESFTAFLLPVDALGPGVPAFVEVTVQNVAPTLTDVSVSPAGRVAIGEEVTADILFTDPGFDDTHMITIDWGDGTITESRSHSYTTAGDYQVVVRVTDDDGGVDEETFDVLAGPYITDLVLPDSVAEGSVAFITGRVGGTDLSTARIRLQTTAGETLHLVSATTGEFSVPVTFPDDGVQTIALSGVDGDLNLFGGPIAHELTVNNVRPELTSVTISPTGPVAVGSEVTVQVAFTDDGVFDTHQLGVDWGDGYSSTVPAGSLVGSGTVTVTHVYTNALLMGIGVVLSDDDGGSVNTSLTIEVTGGPSATTPTTGVPTTTIEPVPSTTPEATSPATTSPETTSPETTSPATTSPATTGPSTTSPATTGPSTTAPGSGGTAVRASGPLVAGLTVDLIVDSPIIVAGRNYRGTVRSTPFEVGPATATVDGTITFEAVQLPSDWTSGQHTVTLTEVDSGAVAEIAFVVDAQGDPSVVPVTVTVPTFTLPSTGGGGGAVPVSLFALAFGLALMAVTRRRVPRSVFDARRVRFPHR